MLQDFAPTIRGGGIDFELLSLAQLPPLIRQNVIPLLRL